MATLRQGLEIPEGLLEQLPGEVQDRIPRDWATAWKEACEEAASWSWAKNSTGEESLSPLWNERMGYRPGRRRKPPIPDGVELTAYGYDDQGRVLVAIQRHGTGDDATHTLLWHGENEALSLLITPERSIPVSGETFPPSLLAVWRARLERGRPIEVVHFAAGGGSVERLRWSGDVLVDSIVDQRREGSLDFRDEFSWDGAKLDSITRDWEANGREVIYERPWSTARLDEALGDLEPRLADEIIAAVAKAGLRKPICAMALSYCEGERSLPPVVILCPEDVRQELVDGDEGDFWYRWHAAEWMAAGDVTQLEDYGSERFRNHCHAVDRQVKLDGDHMRIARLLRATARRLNEHEWGNVLDRTSDFTVYAWEIHGESLEEDLAASRLGADAL